MRRLIALALIVAGLLACAYGALIWRSIPRSDTRTADLVVFGASFALPGLVAIVAGVWLVRSARARGEGTRLVSGSDRT